MKKQFKITLSIIVISVMAFLALASGSTSNLSEKDAYDAGYKIGQGIGTLLNDNSINQEKTDTLSNDNLAVVSE